MLVLVLTISFEISILIGNVVASSNQVELLSSAWHLTNNKTEAYQKVDPNILKGKDRISITYNLHGTCLLDGDASAIIFDQNGWKYISLSKYGQNCKDGDQTVEIALSDFKDAGNAVLDTNDPLTDFFHSRLWYDASFTVDVISAAVFSSSSGPSSSSTSVTPTVTQSQAGFTGEYYDNKYLIGNPVLTRQDDSINFDWKNSSPDPKISPNTFSTRWTKNDNFTDGTYEFSVTVDDGVRLFVDNEKILDKWIGQAATTYKVSKSISSGTHKIVMEYYEDYGGAVAKMSYAKTNLTTNLSAIPTVTPTPTLTTTLTGSWPIQSVDAMKSTKDMVCGQQSESWIGKWVDKAVELGANYVSISTPYENPSCGDASSYTKTWIKVIRSRGLKVWFRQMPLSFEGIYNVQKNNSSNYLNLISDYVKSHADNYQDGDIFTPIPEPQNGGITGITYCAGNVCQFAGQASFNQWLRDAMTVSKNAFAAIGKNGVKIGYFGFDGFVAWGDNNPDWNGILEDATVQAMGNITIDHYPEAIGETMASGLDQLQARYPGVPIVIGEWGTINGGDVQQQVKNTMGASKRPGVVGFNYWQFGPGGAGEQLFNDDFSNRSQFADVQSFYKNP